MLYSIRLRHVGKYVYVGCYYKEDLGLIAQAFKRAGIKTMVEFGGTTPTKRYLYYLYVQRGQSVKEYFE